MNRIYFLDAKLLSQEEERMFFLLKKRNEKRGSDPNKVIFNYSSCDFPNNIKTILAFGLDFRLPIYILNYYTFFLPPEKLL